MSKAFDEANTLSDNAVMKVISTACIEKFKLESLD